ncbi:MAG TPA: hypothetical protein DEQ27_00485 [Prevotella sp.]|nr:hypothetical protein [Prevotella sp.]
MKEDKNEILLNEFFANARNTEIPDNGFSDNVMRSIGMLENKKMLRLSHLWTIICSMLGIVFIIFSVANANIKWYSGKDIAGIILSHIIRIMKFIATFDLSHIPQFVYPIPLIITILLAIMAIKSESKYKEIF